MAVALYFHTPFCGKKCPYCDFYSVPYRKSQAAAYTEAVLRNLEWYYTRYGPLEIDTVYMGGGTPALLAGEYWQRILQTVSTLFKVDPRAEITIEANPDSVTEKKLRFLREIGFNRISIGVQSFSNEVLQGLGRRHTAEQAEQAVWLADAAGFREISIDLMLGVPEQTPEILGATLAAASWLPVTHISAYLLKIEEGTPFHRKEIFDRLPDEEITAQMYLNTVSIMGRMGFFQYEISNFARPGHESRHNLHYWRCEEYIGIGPDAHSFFDGKRYAAPPDVELFIQGKTQQETVTEENPCGFEEWMMLRLRLAEGVDLRECAARYGVDYGPILEKAFQLEKQELLCVRDFHIHLTPKGCLVSNSVIGELVFADFNQKPVLPSQS